MVQQAWAATRSGDKDEAVARFGEAEEIYRRLRQTYDGAGRFDEAGHFFSKEMTMRRMLMPRWSVARVWSKTVDLFCAYGESPPRVIGSAALLNLACAVVYFAVGIKSADGIIGFDSGGTIGENIHHYLNCVYYSVVTFTTLGYGDMTPPDGIARPLAATVDQYSFEARPAHLRSLGKRSARDRLACTQHHHQPAPWQDPRARQVPLKSSHVLHYRIALMAPSPS